MKVVVFSTYRFVYRHKATKLKPDKLIVFVITLLSSTVLHAQEKITKSYLDHNRSVEQVTHNEHVKRTTQYVDSENRAKSETLKQRNSIVEEFLAKEDGYSQIISNREFKRQSFLQKNSRREDQSLFETTTNSSSTVGNQLSKQQNIVKENLSNKTIESQSYTDFHKENIEQFFSKSATRQQATFFTDNQEHQHDFLELNSGAKIGIKKPITESNLDNDSLTQLKDTEKSQQVGEQKDYLTPSVAVTEESTDGENKDLKDLPIQTDLVEYEKTTLISGDSHGQESFTSERIVESEPKTSEVKVLSLPESDSILQPTERLDMENNNPTTTYLLQFAVLSERKNPTKVARSLGLPNNVNLMIRPKGQLFTYVTEDYHSFEEANTKAAEIHNVFGADVVVVDDHLNNVKNYSKKADNTNVAANIKGIYLQIAFLNNKISLNEFQKRQKKLHSQSVSIIKVNKGYKYVLGPFQDEASARTKQAELKTFGVESYYYIHQ